jgi:hypothetical protein
MNNVTRFEANLLRLLYYFLRREPAERALPLVEERRQAPACLSRVTVRLVQEALAKGTTFLLAYRGGWRVERHLRGPLGAEKPAEGRLWQRTPPKELALSFSRHSLEFLVWITAEQPKDKGAGAWGPAPDKLTVGDLVLLFFANEGLREAPETAGVGDLRKRQPFVSHGLAWLAYPRDYEQAPAEVVPDFGPWLSGVGACVLEALQTDLRDRWLAVEGDKERIVDPQQMRFLGRSQERVLSAFLDAVDKANRLDLARFLLRAAERLLGGKADGQNWIGGLQTVGLRLADRAATYQAALSFVRALERLQGWARRARTIGYWDEGYEAAKLYLADWEAVRGDTLAEKALGIVRQVDPLRQAGPGELPGTRPPVAGT